MGSRKPRSRVSHCLVKMADTARRQRKSPARRRLQGPVLVAKRAAEGGISQGVLSWLESATKRGPRTAISWMAAAASF
jgi:hypothetical protein